MRSGLVRVAAVALGACLVASCSLGDDDSDADPHAAIRGGSIVIGITEPASIDPSNAYEPNGFLVVDTMCDRLVELDPKTGDLELGLAKTFNAESRSSATVTIRNGLRFSDGQSVDAADVIFSLSRAVSEASPVSENLRHVFGYDVVHGDVEPEDEDSREAEVLAGLFRIHGKAFTMLHASPTGADYLRVLTLPLASIIPEDLGGRTAEDFARRPECVGPYKLAAPWDHGDPAIKLERNPEYDAGESNARRAGAVDNIEFRIFPDAAAAVRAFEAGELDATAVPPDQVPPLRSRGDELVLSPSPLVEYVGVPANNRGLPTERPEIRLALSLALDRTALAEKVYGGVRRPATGFLPPTVGRDRLANGCSHSVPATADVPRAQKVLSDAGVDLRGQTIKMYFNDEFANGALLREVAAQWKANLGLELDLKPMPWEQFLELANGGQGFDGAFRESWLSEYPSGIDYLRSLFSSEEIGDDNFARFTRHDFDRDLERRVVGAVDQDERRRELQKLERKLCDELPLIPVAFGSTAHLVRVQRLGSLGGYTDPTTGRLAVRGLYVK